VGHFLLRSVKSGLSAIISFNLDQEFWSLVVSHQKKHRQCKKTWRKELEELELSDPHLYKHFNYILSAECDVANLDLTFTVGEEFKMPSSSSTSPFTTKCCTVNLKDNGENIHVTKLNRKEYVKLRMDYRKTRMVRQAAAVHSGLALVVPLEVTSLFTSQELGLLMSGISEIKVDEWKKHTIYNGGTHTTPVILWLWKLMESLSQEKKALFLQFSTGCSRLPPGGFAVLNPKFCIYVIDGSSSQRLPTAATCFHQLKLPNYKEEKDLKKMVMTAILHGSEGFSFS